MYGQTEATARMAYCGLPDLISDPLTVGRAIQGERFKLVDGELYYQGPNVMLGYAEKKEDLSSLCRPSWLATGDIGTISEDGFIAITGRKKRFIKLSGHRLDLDHIETQLTAQYANVLCTGNDKKLIVGIVISEALFKDTASSIKAFVHQSFLIHPSFVKVVKLDSIPLLANGKKDFQFVLNQVLD